MEGMAKRDDNCVYKTNGDIEAQQVKAFLAAHGIPCEFRGESLRMTHGFTLDGLGVVRICVPEAMVERARMAGSSEGLPAVRLDGAGAFADALHAEWTERRRSGRDLPVWDGELYLEYR